MKKNIAFTLAELLIALTILGVIAALTIPTLMKNVHNKQLEAGFKKSYSTISHTLKLMEIDTGGALSVDNYKSVKFKNVFKKYVKYAFDCGNTSYNVASNKECAFYKSSLSTGYKTANGKNYAPAEHLDDGALILNDGTLVMFDHQTFTDLSIKIFVDTNGYNKGPNRLGYDAFFLFILSNKGGTYTFGSKESTNCSYYRCSYYQRCSFEDTDSSKENGWGCAIKALTEKDYFKNLR